jgi:putative DNA primase/helicase
MRRGRELVGCQLIQPTGDKKFLFGQRSGGAEFIFGQRGAHVLCEGYATALSTQQALRNLKVQYVLHVTFSAGNMKKVAAELPAGFVIADNDASGTGERVAREIGWPYWISDTTGEDANDYAQRRGVFALAMGLKQAMHGRLRA